MASAEDTDGVWAVDAEELVEDAGGNMSAKSSNGTLVVDMEEVRAGMEDGVRALLPQLVDADDSLDEDENEEGVGSSFIQEHSQDLVESQGKIAMGLSAATLIGSVLLSIYTSLPATILAAGSLTLIAGSFVIPWAIIGLVGYVTLVGIGCSAYDKVMGLFKKEVSWPKCFMKGLALPFMLIGNVFECFALLIDGAIHKFTTVSGSAGCNLNPMFKSFWSKDTTVAGYDIPEGMG